MSNKNPYSHDTPEWQLWENMQSSLLQASAFARDADEYLKKAAAARERAERFKIALERLSK